MIYICNLKELEYAATLLGIESNNICDQLIQRNIQMRGETVTSPLNLQNSRDVKDAFIKGILFSMKLHVQYCVTRLGIIIFIIGT